MNKYSQEESVCPDRKFIQGQPILASMIHSASRTNMPWAMMFVDRHDQETGLIHGFRFVSVMEMKKSYVKTPFILDPRNVQVDLHPLVESGKEDACCVCEEATSLAEPLMFKKPGRPVCNKCWFSGAFHEMGIFGRESAKEQPLPEMEEQEPEDPQMMVIPDSTD